MPTDSDEAAACASPSTAALNELLKRIQADPDIEAEIKSAVLEDLESEIPASLSHLRKALGPKGAEDAAQ